MRIDSVEVESPGDQEDDSLDRCDSRKPTRTTLGCLEQTVDGFEESVGLACLRPGPTDSKLLETARVKLVEAAKAQGIVLKQTYAKEGQLLGYKAGRYAHARQFKRMRKAIKRQATIVGRLHREIARKMTTLSQAVQDALGVSIDKAKRLIAQSRSKKAQDKQPKLYSWHAPEVECISKVRREVANIIVSPAHKVGDETGRSVDRSLPVHALLATASCEATGTKCRALGPRRVPRGNGVTCEHQCGWDARLSGMVNKSGSLEI